MTDKEYYETLDCAYVVKSKDLTPKELIERRIIQIHEYRRTIHMCGGRKTEHTQYYYDMIERIEKEIKNLSESI